MSLAGEWGGAQDSAYNHYAPRTNRAGWNWSKPKGAVLWICALLVAWAMVSTAWDAAKVYRWARIEKYKELDRARIYYYDPGSMCNVENAQYRVSVGPHFDRCDEAKRIIGENPDFEALIDVLEQLKFCSAGSCLVFSMNIFHSLGLIFGTAFVVVALITILVVSKIVMAIYRNFENGHALPLYANPLTQAAYEKKNYAPSASSKWD